MYKQDDSASGRSKVWMFLGFIIVASGMFTLIHLSDGLHSHVVEERSILIELRAKIDELQESNAELINKLKNDRSKTVKLREKSRIVTEELLGQQQKIKRAQTDLAICRVQFDSMVRNCTGKSRMIGTQYNTTLLELRQHVTENKQLRLLLSKNLQERSQLEISLANMQGRTYNLTQQIKRAKTLLVRAAKDIKQSKEDVEYFRTAAKLCTEQGVDILQSSANVRQTYLNNQNKLLAAVANAGGSAEAAKNSLEDLPEMPEFHLELEEPTQDESATD